MKGNRGCLLITAYPLAFTREVMRNALTGEVRSDGLMRKTKRETGKDGYQQSLVRKLRRLFPGCIILKNDANYLQGVPDILVLFGETWAALECKVHGKAREQPNQNYYVDMMNAMSFAAFINPENEESVLGELQRTFASRRPARVSKRQQISLDQLRRRQAS